MKTDEKPESAEGRGHEHHDHQHEHGEHEKFVYFVDGAKYEWGAEKITGREIRARIKNLDPKYAIFLEGQGHKPDEEISDTTVVHLEKGKEPRRFYTVPPATFGAI